MAKERLMLRVALATYSPDEYAKLVATAEDASELEPLWEDWYKNMLETRAKLALQGIYCVEVAIEMEALEKFCQEHNLKNNSGTRSEYAATMLQQRDQQQRQPRQPQLPQRKSKKKRRQK